MKMSRRLALAHWTQGTVLNVAQQRGGLRAVNEIISQKVNS